MRQLILNLIEHAVYPRLYPHKDFPSGYLEGIYQRAGVRVVFTHCALVVLVWLGAWCCYLRSFSRLSDSQLQKYYRRLLTSRFYTIRLVAYAVKSHALVAAYGDYGFLEQAVPKGILTEVELEPRSE